MPQWYQNRFIPEEIAVKNLHYLDLKPRAVVKNGHKYIPKSLHHWGASKCFYQENLYTIKFGDWKSTEIEERFFGEVDRKGVSAVEYFNEFKHPAADKDSFTHLLRYMSLQKLRTPKGLDLLSVLVNTKDRNKSLFAMQEYQNMHCAIWSECIWSIADASESTTKFIISDHPVTVYNRDCFPASKYCIGYNDPDITQVGTHTFFPLSLDKLLILTNLSWVRNPYMNPKKIRPNPNLFRDAMFNFMDIHVGRKLSELEVNEINFIIKKRAYQYVAAFKQEWLYPEKYLVTEYWNKLGNGLLLMPDPRSVKFTTDIVVGFSDRHAIGFDEYGRTPCTKNDKNTKQERSVEWETFQAFQGQFARLFGPERRGVDYNYAVQERYEDSPDFHAYHLTLDQKYSKHYAKKRRMKIKR